MKHIRTNLYKYIWKKLLLYIYIYIKQVIGQRNKMFVLITMDLPSPRRHSALAPSQAGMVEVTGDCVDSALFWNWSIISRGSHCRAGLRLRRDRHTQNGISPATLPASWFHVLCASAHLAPPSQSCWQKTNYSYHNRREEIFCFLSRRNEHFIYLWAF